MKIVWWRPGTHLKHIDVESPRDQTRCYHRLVRSGNRSWLSNHYAEESAVCRISCPPMSANFLGPWKADVDQIAA